MRGSTIIRLIPCTTEYTPPTASTLDAGAIFTSSNCSIHVDGITSFSANVAQDDGGNVGLRPLMVPTVVVKLGFL